MSDLRERRNRLPLHDEPRVTFITTAFNTGPFITKTIRSVLDQTEQNFEMIVLDDASRDQTLSLAMGTVGLGQKSDPRFRFPYLTENVGVAKAREEARKQSIRSKYVVFLDSDDVLDPNFAMRLCNLLDRLPDHVVAAFGGFVPIDEDDNVIRKYASIHSPVDRLAKPDADGIVATFSHDEYLIKSMIAATPSQMVYRVDAIKNKRFRSDVKIDDMRFALDVLSDSPDLRIVRVVDVMTRYRRRKGQITNNSGLICADLENITAESVKHLHDPERAWEAWNRAGHRWHELGSEFEERRDACYDQAIASAQLISATELRLD